MLLVKRQYRGNTVFKNTFYYYNHYFTYKFWQH